MAAERLLINHGVIGAVLTGGSSRRFAGGDKAAVIGPLVVAALRGAGIDPVIAVGGTPGVLDVPTIADRYPGEGPLGGLATAATFARAGRILAVTCDLPLLDSATIQALLAATDDIDEEVGVVASVDGEPQVSLGLWPARWARPLHQAMRAGERRFRHILTVGPITSVEVSSSVLQDADDEATLAALVRGPRDMADPDAPEA